MGPGTTPPLCGRYAGRLDVPEGLPGDPSSRCSAKHRRPGKDYAGRVDSSASWIHIVMARCMLKRLASV